MKSNGADLVLLGVTAPLLLTAPNLSFVSFRWTGVAGADVLGAGATAIVSLAWLGLLALALLPEPRLEISTTVGRRLRLVAVLCMTAAAIVAPMLSDIAARLAFGLAADAPVVATPHDGGVLQTEAAIAALGAGQNPYAIDYGATAMAQSHHSRPELWRALGFNRNPAFEFFPYPPLSFAVSMPFEWLSRTVFGAYDQRYLHLLALGVLGWFAARSARDPKLGIVLLAASVASPLLVPFFAQGHNDVYWVAAMAGALLARAHGHHRAAALALGIACGFKQFAWLAIPLWVADRWANQPPGSDATKVRSLLAEQAPLLAVVVVTFVPFVLWDPQRLWFCLVTAQGSLYPARGTGLGLTNLLVAFGAVTSPRDPTPQFWAYLVFVALPLVWLARRLAIEQRPAWVLPASFALVLASFLFFSRFFAPSYLWGLSVVAAIALVSRHEADT